MEKKYEILKDTEKDFFGHNVYRIKALKDFSDVKKGDIGGFVESEDNLSQEGNCWIYDNAIACDNSVVGGHAKVKNYAKICDNAFIDDNSVVMEYAVVGDNVTVCYYSVIRNRAIVGGDTIVEDKLIR